MNPYHPYPGYFRGHPMHPPSPRALNRGLPPPFLMQQHLARVQHEANQRAMALMAYNRSADLEDHIGKSHSTILYFLHLLAGWGPKASAPTQLAPAGGT